MTLPVDRTIADTIASGAIGDVIAVDLRVSTGDYPNADLPLHWRHSRDFSGNNIMALGIWYEQMARWVGQASSAFAVGQVVVKHRKDESGARVPITIPDHVDVTGQLQQGGQYRLLLSSVLGHAPGRTEAWIFGDKGTLAFITPNNGEPYLQLGKKGGAMGALAVDPAKLGAWRVEEEFVNAVRGREAVTHTDFVTAIKYMEWTDAVTCRCVSGARCSCRCFETSGKVWTLQGAIAIVCAASTTGILSLPRTTSPPRGVVLIQAESGDEDRTGPPTVSIAATISSSVTCGGPGAARCATVDLTCWPHRRGPVN